MDKARANHRRLVAYNYTSPHVGSAETQKLDVFARHDSPRVNER